MAALLPALAVFWFFAAPVVTFVFGPSWTDAAPLVRILALGVAVAPLAGQNAQVINACGRGDWVLAVDLVRRPAGLAALVVGGCFGLEGLCWAKVAADLVDWLVVSFFSRRLTGASFLREALAL
jgi:O-antigen/teichoic acid export membrane protein